MSSKCANLKNIIIPKEYDENTFLYEANEHLNKNSKKFKKITEMLKSENSSVNYDKLNNGIFIFTLKNKKKYEVEAIPILSYSFQNGILYMPWKHCFCGNITVMSEKIKKFKTNFNKKIKSDKTCYLKHDCYKNYENKVDNLDYDLTIASALILNGMGTFDMTYNINEMEYRDTLMVTSMKQIK